MKGKCTSDSSSPSQEFLRGRVLGTKNGLQWYSGDEHNEMGNINEEPIIRRKMMDKRIGKLDLVDKEVPLELKVNFFGDKDSENIVVSWGSPKGAIIEALNQLKEEGYSLGFIQVRMIHPFPSAYLKQMLVRQNAYNRHRR